MADHPTSNDPSRPECGSDEPWDVATDAFDGTGDAGEISLPRNSSSEDAADDATVSMNVEAMVQAQLHNQIVLDDSLTETAIDSGDENPSATELPDALDVPTVVANYMTLEDTSLETLREVHPDDKPEELREVVRKGAMGNIAPDPEFIPTPVLTRKTSKYKNRPTGLTYVSFTSRLTRLTVNYRLSRCQSVASSPRYQI
jgi:hypothetical protein